MPELTKEEKFSRLTNWEIDQAIGRGRKQRIKRFFVDYDFICKSFRGVLEGKVRIVEQLPKDFEIESVSLSHDRNAFEFRVSSWEWVPSEEFAYKIPELEINMYHSDLTKPEEDDR